MSRIDRHTRRHLTERLDEIAGETREIKQLLQQAEKDQFVVVQFHGNSRRYTYEVEEPCKVGDYCVVWAPRSGRYELVAVVALGRGQWHTTTKIARRVGPAELVARLIEHGRSGSPATFYGFTHEQLLDAVDFARVRGWEPQVAREARSPEADTTPPVVIPDGTYRVTCAAADRRVSRHAGRQYLMARHVVIEGPYAGTLLWQPLIDTEAASWVWEDAIVRLEPSELIGRQLIAEVAVNEFNGIRRSKVGKLNAVERPGDDEDDDPFRGSDR